MAVAGHCIDIDGYWWHAPGSCAGAVNNCSGKCCTAAEGSPDHERCLLHHQTEPCPVCQSYIAGGQ